MIVCEFRFEQSDYMIQSVLVFIFYLNDMLASEKQWAEKQWAERKPCVSTDIFIIQWTSKSNSFDWQFKNRHFCQASDNRAHENFCL